MFGGSSVRSFLIIGQTSVIITTVIWYWPRIHDLFQCQALMQKHLTSDLGWPASSVLSSYCTWIVICLYANLQVSPRISVLILISQYNFFTCIYTLLHIKETQVMKSNKVIYSVLKFTVVCHVIVLLLAVLQRQ